MTKLLDRPFLSKETLKETLKEEASLLFDRLDDCPINPKDDDAKGYAETFLQHRADLLRRLGADAPPHEENQALKQSIVRHLESNRSDKARLESELLTDLIQASKGKGRGNVRTSLSSSFRGHRSSVDTE